MSQRFKDQRVVITGASSGIGRELASQLGSLGARIVLAARNAERLQQTADEIAEQGGRAWSVVTDVTDPSSVARLIAQAVDILGGIDILINSAGVLVTGPASSVSNETLRANMEVNFFGAVHCIRAALPHMLSQRRGHIVNLSSMAGLMPFPGMAAYSASKFALKGYSDTLRNELRRYGIHVTVAYPGVTDTEMLSGHLPSFRASLAYRLSKRPPHLVARAILRAIEKRRPEVIPSPLERFVVAAHALAPHLTRRILDWASGGSPPPGV